MQDICFQGALWGPLAFSGGITASNERKEALFASSAVANACGSSCFARALSRTHHAIDGYRLPSRRVVSARSIRPTLGKRYN